MRIGVEVNESAGESSLEGLTSRLRRAAGAGLDIAWSAQLFGLDALTALAVAGQQVPGIELGTAIVPTYPRHPMALASQALTVQAATGNRLTLGIGSSHRPLMEGAFGYPFERPARHMREYLTVIGPLLRGEAVDFDGEFVTAHGQVSVAGAAPPPLLVAAIGPAMLRVTGELADGTIAVNAGPFTLAGYVVPEITRAAAGAGRSAPRIIAAVHVSVTHAREARRAEIAEVLKASSELPAYRRVLDREGVTGVADVAFIGDEGEVERQVRRLAETGVTELLALPFPFRPGPDRERTIDFLGSLTRAGVA